jgi:hypothetical protein
MYTIYSENIEWLTRKTLGKPNLDFGRREIGKKEHKKLLVTISKKKNRFNLD